MSDLFGISYAEISDTPQVCEALDEYITEMFGSETLVMGMLAFDNDQSLVDLRVYLQGTVSQTTYGLEDGETPHGDGEEAWDDFAQWMNGLGAIHAFSFERRPHWIGHSNPVQASNEIVDKHLNRCPTIGLVYHGHLITTGEHHGLLMPGPNPVGLDAMSTLMDSLDEEGRAAVGESVLRMLQKTTDVDPRVMEAMELVTHHNGNEPLSDQEKDILEQAVRSLEATLTGMGTPPPKRSPMDVPDIKPRPDVPNAFYN